MILRDLRELVHRQLDYNPDNAKYRKGVDQRLQHHYDKVCDGKDWHFLHVEADVTLRADITGEAGTRQVTALSGNLRKVTATAPYTFPTDVAGQTFIDPNGTERKIVSVGTDVNPNDTIYLASTLSGTITGADTYDWTIRYDHFRVPVDCAQVLKFVSRADDRGVLTYISQPTEEEAYLDRDTTGEPAYIIDGEFVEIAAPEQAPTVATTTGGSLVLGRKYEVAYTILEYGLESPLSQVASVTLANSGTNQTLSITGLEDLQWDEGAGAAESGRRKRVYVRDATKRGRWVLAADLAAGTTSTTWDGTVPTSLYSSFREATTYYPTEPRRTVTAWPTPSTDYVVELRYLKRPPPMVADADTPELPTTYHPMLAYFALHDIFLQHGEMQQAGVWQDKARSEYKKLADRYLTNKAEWLRFRPRGSSTRRQHIPLGGTPSIVL